MRHRRRAPIRVRCSNEKVTLSVDPADHPDDSPAAPSTGSITTGLAQLVPNLILTDIVLPEAGAPGNPHAGHFTLGNPTFGGSQAGSQVDGPAIRAVEAFGDRLRAQFANFPLGSSTGGFTYSFDEQSGVYTRNTQSFGPAFTERAADRRPPQAQSGRQLSAFELRYLRRPRSS